MMKKPIPMYDKVFDYALKCASTTDVYDISYLASSWAAVSIVIRSLTEYGGVAGESEAERLLVKCSGILPEAIKNTTEYLAKFKKSDGSFSYQQNTSSSTSQTMPVAKANTREGDVNGTILAISVANSAVRLISCNKIFIPLFDSLDLENFIRAVK